MTFSAEVAARPTPREIARSLTYAQTFVMSSMKQDSARHAPYHLYQPRSNSLASCLALAKIGLIARDEAGNVDAYERGAGLRRVGYAVLTPLGLDVIREITGEKSA